MATEVLADDRALRTGRRERALAQMEKHDLDVLVLGRQANVRYVSGAPQLWVAGTRPFGPTCVVIRETGAIHLLSTWDEGVPDDIPHENLYGIAWNPMNTISVLKGIDGAADAKRVGTDALSPGFAQLLPVAFPNAELVDGELAMRAARRIKTPKRSSRCVRRSGWPRSAWPPPSPSCGPASAKRPWPECCWRLWRPAGSAPRPPRMRRG